MALVCDTSVVLSALDLDDRDHERCFHLLNQSEERLVLPGLTLAELDYWCSKGGLRRSWHEFLEDVCDGAWTVEWPSTPDLRRVQQLQAQYEDLELGLVDATVVAVAERLGERRIATLDRRHFSVVRPAHVDAFDLLPA